jgi:Endonuclease-reverse transcriptase
MQWCLPSGTPTYWSLSRTGTSSTLDLTLTDAPERIIKCHLYHDNYGSDHRGTYSEWNLQPGQAPTRELRLAFDRADWESIGKTVQASVGQPPAIRLK